MQEFNNINNLVSEINNAINTMTELYNKNLANSFLKSDEFYIICGSTYVLHILKENFPEYESFYEKYCDPTRVYIMRKCDFRGDL